MATPLEPDDPRLHAALLEFASEFLVFTDRRGRVVVAVGGGLTRSGFDDAALASVRHIAERIHPDDLPAVLDLIERARTNPGFRSTILARARGDDGTWRTFHSTVIGVEQHSVLGPGAVLRVRPTDEAIEDRDTRFASLSAVVPHGVLSGDIRGWVVFANQQASEILGLPVDELLGEGWRRVIHTEDLADAVDAGQRIARQGTTQHATIRIHRGDELRWVTLTVVPIGQQERPSGWVATLQDITESNEREVRLAHQATHDPLTGLPNRALLEDRLSQADARQARSAGGLGVLFVDLDGFKEVNDTHGHHTGDQVLKAVADRLVGAVRASDTVARFGGDEFVVMVERTSDEGLDALARQVRERLAEPLVAGGVTLRLGASIGMAVSRAGEAPLDLVARADAAMYEQKRRR